MAMAMAVPKQAVKTPSQATHAMAAAMPRMPMLQRVARHLKRADKPHAKATGKSAVRSCNQTALNVRATAIHRLAMPHAKAAHAKTASVKARYAGVVAQLSGSCAPLLGLLRQAAASPTR